MVVAVVVALVGVWVLAVPMAPVRVRLSELRAAPAALGLMLLAVDIAAVLVQMVIPAAVPMPLLVPMVVPVVVPVVVPAVVPAVAPAA